MPRNPAARPSGNLLATLPLLVWTAAILIASSDLFAAHTSGSGLAQILATLGIRLTPEGFRVLHVLVRKTAHVFAYGVEGLLALRATRGRVAAALAIAIVVAIIDEAHRRRWRREPGRRGTCCSTPWPRRRL
ncbi:MAG TPA: VanZ family protein [Thermoanaerobaculia bacterium]